MITIRTDQEYRDAVAEYDHLEHVAKAARRRKELLAAIAAYERQFEGGEHNPGQPFRFHGERRLKTSGGDTGSDGGAGSD